MFRKLLTVVGATALIATPATASAAPSTFDLLFNIKVAHTGKCLDVYWAYTADGAHTQQWTCLGPGQYNQLWKLTAMGSNHYQIRAAHSDKCLDVRLGTNVVQQWTCLGANQANQLWRFEYAGNGKYRIISKHSGQCLDVHQAGTADGAAVQQWPCLPQSNQQWTLVST